MTTDALEKKNRLPTFDGEDEYEPLNENEDEDHGQFENHNEEVLLY